jgi:hypothetical protein
MNQFPIESKVVEKRTLRAGYTYHAHTVIAHANGKVIAELWDNVEKFSPDELMTEEEAVVEQARLDAEKSHLEREFEKVRDVIQGKMDAATALVKEASALAKDCQKDFSSLRAECRPLFRALNDAGWRASSMSC